MTDITAAEMERRQRAALAFCEGIPTDKLERLTLAAYVAEQAFITGMTPTAEGMDLGLKGDACQMMAAAFAGQFIGAGAVNYLEVHLTHESTGPLLVTIQRKHGKTPGRLKAEAEAEAGRLRSALQDIATHADPYGLRAKEALQ